MIYRSTRDGRAGTETGASIAAGTATAIGIATAAATGLAPGIAGADSPTTEGNRPRCQG